MYKQGWYNTSWKKRYFELNGVLNTITYYVESGKGKATKYQMKGMIDFKKTPILTMVKSMKFNQFQVVTSKRVWSFKCENKKETEQWYHAILTLCCKKTKYQNGNKNSDVSWL